jgi:hypothetical protein
MCTPSLRRDDPLGVRIEKQKQDHAQSHQVHVNQKEDTAMVETPASLHAPHSIDCARDGEKKGQNEKRIGMDDREPGDQQREPEAQEDQQNSTEKRSPARIEKAR